MAQDLQEGPQLLGHVQVIFPFPMLQQQNAQFFWTTSIQGCPELVQGLQEGHRIPLELEKPRLKGKWTLSAR